MNKREKELVGWLFINVTRLFAENGPPRAPKRTLYELFMTVLRRVRLAVHPFLCHQNFFNRWGRTLSAVVSVRARRRVLFVSALCLCALRPTRLYESTQS